MFDPSIYSLLSNREKQLVNQLLHCEKQNLDLQLLTGTNLDQLLEIVRVCTLYIDINGEKHSLYSIAHAMKRTGLSFADIYYYNQQLELNSKTKNHFMQK